VKSGKYPGRGQLCIVVLCGGAPDCCIAERCERCAVQVDLTLAGHDHKYERTCPVYKKTCLQVCSTSFLRLP
jgi:hypothetical protein